IQPTTPSHNIPLCAPRNHFKRRIDTRRLIEPRIQAAISRASEQVPSTASRYFPYANRPSSLSFGSIVGPSIRLGNIIKFVNDDLLANEFRPVFLVKAWR